MRERFGCKIYRLALSAGVSCPNRDGTLDTRGCIFCSAGGSGEFAADRSLPIPEQLKQARSRVQAKNPDGKYMAYFQSFTNTWAPVSYLREIFMQALEPEDIVALSVATRPDCLGDEVMELLKEIQTWKPVMVELGLQTIHERTAAWIRRGYPLSVYDEAMRKCREAGLETVVHVILGLPGETVSDMEETVRYVAASGADGIKLQLLQILHGTDLEKEYLAGRVPVMSLEDYTALLTRLLALLPEKMVVHRLTGDGPKRLLAAPVWSADKKRVLNTLRREIPEKLYPK